MTYARVESLLTVETVRAYEQELFRRTEARRVQFMGMIRRALPTTKRTQEVIVKIFNELHNFQGSVPTLKRQIAVAVAAV